MAGNDAEKQAWMLRALGVDVTGGGRRHALLPIWIEAKEAVDARIVQLQQTLLQRNHPGLKRIAELGLNGVTDKNSVGLMAALREADSAASGAPAADKVGAAIQGFKSFLSGNKAVGLIDENPFGVSVDLRDTLTAALTEIDRAVSA